MSQNLDELYEEVQKHQKEPGFKALEAFYALQIEKYRDMLEKGDIGFDIEHTRGRIKECRFLIKLLTE
jgi:hypothetical protein